ncbi:hypothetical protein FPOA_00479 [Fusarium poae]|uniref:Uncharacterized protein n=1 Tax=Fusarium poae TaxID=36050 RepID=A0A1B8B1E4_FUSPO|nr:hypothetical protein FPOA_00479 [Fusarium poae]
MTERTANTYLKRVLDEGEMTRAKLTDQNVSILNYPDPLTSRPQLQRYPQGVTSEMDVRWCRMIEESKKRA